MESSIRLLQKREYQNRKAKNPRRTWDIPRARWAGLGFKPSMNLEQAKVRQRQLNAQLEIKRQEERRKKIEKELRNFENKMKGFSAIGELLRK